jgi:hypothetical protein
MAETTKPIPRLHVLFIEAAAEVCNVDIKQITYGWETIPLKDERDTTTIFIEVSGDMQQSDAQAFERAMSTFSNDDIGKTYGYHEEQNRFYLSGFYDRDEIDKKALADKAVEWEYLTHTGQLPSFHARPPSITSAFRKLSWLGGTVRLILQEHNIAEHDILTQSYDQLA